MGPTKPVLASGQAPGRKDPAASRAWQPPRSRGRSSRPIARAPFANFTTRPAPDRTNLGGRDPSVIVAVRQPASNNCIELTALRAAAHTVRFGGQESEPSG